MTGYGQNESRIELSGYVKDLFSHIRINGDQLTFTDNLVHHRLNADWTVSKAFSVRGALRTRVFTGDQPATPFFPQLLEQGANDWLDLSARARVSDKTLIHSYLDRLYVQYAADRWQIRLGRQRVNWGIHTIWNPNDIFNAYAFTDFDYEERPGSDALSVKYYTGDLSSVEVVLQAFDRIDEVTAAVLWRTNRWNYDFQFLTGKFRRYWVAGGGWAGNLENWGFKGEFSLFAPLDNDIAFNASASVGFDYLTNGGILLNFSALYNARGRTSGTLNDIFAFELSAINLYPYRWSVLTSGGYQIHPLINSALTVVYSPAKSHPVFINPFITWSAARNLDVDLVAQIALSEDFSGTYISPVKAYFVRVKWSY